MTSIIKADNISTVSGSGNITIPTGVKVVGTDAGSIVAPGHVVQVVQGLGTAITVATSTPTTVVQASITVSQGSKVFATACGDMNPATSGDWHLYQIYRDSTGISKRYIGQTAGSSYNLPFSISFVETAGLNAGTYTYSLKVNQGVGSMLYGENGNSQAPTIVLMEIAQ
jgi:hypothetical protein